MHMIYYQKYHARALSLAPSAKPQPERRRKRTSLKQIPGDMKIITSKRLELIKRPIARCLPQFLHGRRVKSTVSER